MKIQKLFLVKVKADRDPDWILKVCQSEAEAREALKEYMDRQEKIGGLGWVPLCDTWEAGENGFPSEKTTVVWRRPTAAMYVLSVSKVKNGEEHIENALFKVYIDFEEFEIEE